MISGTNQDQGQRFNRRVVLDTIRSRGPLSRADIARFASLSHQSVSNLVEELIEAGLLVEERRYHRQRGQPPIDLMINPSGGFSVGVAFDHRSLVGVLIDLAGGTRRRAETAIEDAHPSTVLPAVQTMVHDLIRAAKVPIKRIYGVGLVMPGLSHSGTLVGLDPDTTHAWLPHWRGISVAVELERRLRLPAFTDNDAAAAAIGERLYGAGRSFRTFVQIYLSAGIGAGIILNGQPYRSRSGRSGEIGHMVVVAGGRPCPCGNHGCLERYASLSSAQAALSGQPEGNSPIEPDALAAAVIAKDARMMAWLDTAALCLAAAITSCENLFDPESVLIGGTLSNVILDALVERILPLPRSVASDRPSDIPRLLRVEAGLVTAALGAASLPIFDSTAADLSLLLKQT